MYRDITVSKIFCSSPFEAQLLNYSIFQGLRNLQMLRFCRLASMAWRGPDDKGTLFYSHSDVYPRNLLIITFHMGL